MQKQQEELAARKEALGGLPSSRATPVQIERPPLAPKLDATEVEEVMPGGSKRAKVLRNLEKAMKKRRSILSKLRTAE